MTLAKNEGTKTTIKYVFKIPPLISSKDIISAVVASASSINAVNALIDSMKAGDKAWNKVEATIETMNSIIMKHKTDFKNEVMIEKEPKKVPVK